jgi:hypothetical protein
MRRGKGSAQINAESFKYVTDQHILLLTLMFQLSSMILLTSDTLSIYAFGSVTPSIKVCSPLHLIESFLKVKMSTGTFFATLGDEFCM